MGHISHARGHGARTRRLNIYDTYHTGDVRPGLRDSGMVPAGMRPALVFPERSQLPIGYDELGWTFPHLLCWLIIDDDEEELTFLLPILTSDNLQFRLLNFCAWSFFIVRDRTILVTMSRSPIPLMENWWRRGRMFISLPSLASDSLQFCKWRLCFVMVLYSKRTNTKLRRRLIDQTQNWDVDEFINGKRY